MSSSNQSDLSCSLFQSLPSCLNMSKKDIYYSDKYTDDKFEYRHVMLPKDLAKLVPKTHLMSEAEWRNLGVQQSLGGILPSCFFSMTFCFYSVLRLGPLHAPRARASHPPVQTPSHRLTAPASSRD